MAALLLEDYLESTDHVPSDMKEALAAMRTLDLRVQSLSFLELCSFLSLIKLLLLILPFFKTGGKDNESNH